LLCACSHNKKNWLFIGHDPEAGRRGAVLYTLLIRASNHGVDPLAYPKDVIERLTVTRPVDLNALLPANWAAANRANRPLAKPLRSDAAWGVPASRRPQESNGGRSGAYHGSAPYRNRAAAG
jgi:hypothetical protein